MSKEDNREPKSEILSRRRFIGVTAGAAGLTVVPRHVIAGSHGLVAPSDRLNIAGIGVGGRGVDDLEGVKSQNIVALCDVDDKSAAETYQKYPNAKRYRDFRKMLDQEKGIDAVVIATPDHIHAVAAMAALKAGKHVYCEKPLTRTVQEARTLTATARETKLATQMGNQGMAFEGNRLIKEWIWDGAIGPVRDVHVWSDRPTHEGKLFWEQGIERPKEEPPVPPTLDWDLWLGPAPFRPYHPVYAPFSWRGWWDFGSGGLGDMGVHNLAPVFTALKLRPRRASTRAPRWCSRKPCPLRAWFTMNFPPVGTCHQSASTGTTAACFPPGRKSSRTTASFRPRTEPSSSATKARSSFTDGAERAPA